jgi:hypothetical protein
MAIHIYPINDLIEHRIDQDAADCDCPCDPEVKWRDEDGEILEEPLVIHQALDVKENSF